MVALETFVLNVLPPLTLVGIALAASLLVLLVLTFTKLREHISEVHVFVKENALWLGLLAAVLATSGSLFYSEIMDYVPCPYCWYQRILMYPQVLLFGVALLARTRDVFKYALSLSLVGFGISVYHYIVQIFQITTECLAPGGRELDAAAGECSSRFVFDYGFISIPFMAAVAFAIIALTSLIALRKHVSSRDR